MAKAGHHAKAGPQNNWTELIGILASISLLLFAYYAFGSPSDLPHSSLRVPSTKLQTGAESQSDSEELENKQVLPATFDSRSNWPKCNLPVWDAGENCSGGTWAIATADVLSHQLCVLNGQLTPLSPQAILNCVKPPSGDGCSSGSPIDAWSYAAIYGLPSASCLPYTGVIAGCSSTCKSVGPEVAAVSSTSKSISGVTLIQGMIQRKGAVQATFEEFTDFISYTGGIYEHKSGRSEGMVSVKLVGWGIQKGVKYWIGAAAKGANWGMGGYFYMKMGELKVEESIVA